MLAEYALGTNAEHDSLLLSRKSSSTFMYMELLLFRVDDKTENVDKKENNKERAIFSIIGSDEHCLRYCVHLTFNNLGI